MYRSLNLAEDNILKQVISDRFALAATDRQYDWRESIPANERKPMPDIIVTRGEKEHQFSLEDVADAIGESLADLLVARAEDETSIFSDVNRNFVSLVARNVAVSLTKALEEGDRLRLSESDLYLLIEKALLENEAYDVAKSLAFRRSLEKTGHVESGTSPHALPVRLIRRNGNVVPWSETKIEIAVRKAFLTIHENPEPAVEIAKAVTEMSARATNPSSTSRTSRTTSRRSSCARVTTRPPSTTSSTVPSAAACAPRMRKTPPRISRRIP